MNYVNPSNMYSIYPLKLGCSQTSWKWFVCHQYTRQVSDLTDYRLISVIHYFSKILERIMYNRLFSYVSQQKIVYSKQFGFQSGHSTGHAILQLAHEILSKLLDEIIWSEALSDIPSSTKRFLRQPTLLIALLDFG